MRGEALDLTPRPLDHRLEVCDELFVDGVVGGAECIQSGAARAVQDPKHGEMPMSLLIHRLLGPFANGFCCAPGLLDDQKPRGLLDDSFHVGVLMPGREEEQKRIGANALIDGGVHLEAVQTPLLAALTENRERLPPS